MIIKGFDLARGLDETVIDHVVPDDKTHAEVVDEIIYGLLAAGCNLDSDVIAEVFPNSPDKRLGIVVRGRVRYIVRKDMK